MNEKITNEKLRKPMDFDALERTVKSLDENTRKLNEMIKEEGLSDPNVERLNELISDEEYCKKLFELESAEEVQRVLAQDGAELSVEYVNALGEYIFGLAEHLLENGGELNEDELESVAGGVLGEVTYVGLLNGVWQVFTVHLGHGAAAGAAAAGGAAAGGAAAGGVAAGGVAAGGAAAGGVAAGGAAAGGGVVATAGLSTLACVGIAAGAVVAAALIGVGIYFAVRQRW